jgi:hypothetical protein
LFFNRRAWRGCVPTLQAAVRNQLDAFFTQPVGIRDYDALAVRLRRLYRDPKQFGGSEVGRNDISLITFAGPVGKHRITRAGDHYYPAASHHHLDGRLPENQKSGLLYTGDIKMHEKLRVALQARLTTSRWSNLGSMQVPHHGADGAWADPDPAAWKHRWSIFSYGLTNTHGHPGKATQAALSRHNPVLVNEDHGFAWWYVAEWP